MPFVLFGVSNTLLVILEQLAKHVLKMCTELCLLVMILLKCYPAVSSPSLCEDSQEMKVLPSLIPQHSTATPEGFIIFWAGVVQPMELAQCFDSVTLHFNGRPGTQCCHGYQAVTKSPRITGDVQPFMVQLCGNQTVFITFTLGGHVRISKQRLKNAPPCTMNTTGFLITIGVSSVIFVIFLFSANCVIKKWLQKRQMNKMDQLYL